MMILWALAKIVFSMMVIVLGTRGDITLGDYMIIMTLLWFVWGREKGSDNGKMD